MEDKERIENTAKGLKLLEERGLVKRQGSIYGTIYMPTQKFNQLLGKYFFSNSNEPYIELLIKIVDGCEPPATHDEIMYMVPALDVLMNRVFEITSEKRKPASKQQLYKFFERKYKEYHR